MPKGRVASSPEEADAICRELGGAAVVKAQVYAGGRGKAGGVRLVSSPSEARDFAASLIGSRLVTHQTGPQGVPVHKLLVEAPAEIDRELYLAITVDRRSQGPLFIASASGGMAIEELAATDPDKIKNEPVDIAVGLQPFQTRRLSHALGLEKAQFAPAGRIMASIFNLFMEQDCTLVEINPLVVTGSGLLAVDAKVDFEDDALFRHSELSALADPAQQEPLELEASRNSIAYVKLDGTVGCLVNGAGLAMATLDLVQKAGLSPANFLDVGGAADVEKVTKAVDITLSDPDVTSVLVNIFGGILRCDVVAHGIVAAYAQRGATVPLTVRMLGTNVEEGRKILGESGLTVAFADTLNEVEQSLKAVAA